MFGTEMHWITFVILLSQLMVLFFQIINYFSNINDQHAKRYLILIVVYINYNFFSGIFPDSNINFLIVIQNIIAYSAGIIFAVYFIYYLYKEFHITPFIYFTIKRVILYLSVLFVCLFIIPYAFTLNLTLARKLFIGIPLVLAIIFSFKALIELIKILKQKLENTTEKHFKLRVISANFGIISFLMLPLMVFIGDYQHIEQPLVNFGFFIMAFAYIKNHIYQRKREAYLLIELKNKLKEDKTKEMLSQFRLTNKEFEIATHILEGYLYKDIGEMLFITEKTVSKHASNIFKKIEVTNRKDFQEYFK
ncbi:helix-turn-helix transcriptional regulator [Kordia sp. YSTF-M3]|uniref:Helix-turn-helix transcriptional regulator n=1 Tax=Kordia aestuariivivens TaxID=2759037 RepID=A0ABR7QEB6_9FLAO|nr:helix-turn-helix transcriptional regulator [Kordia aestuariivivens]MBC8756890.1 helix-turn-helix transcriptional regulator [Kordia aestuariivivens]